MDNPLNSTYLGRWAVNSFNTWALCTFVALNPWVLLFEHEPVDLDDNDLYEDRARELRKDAAEREKGLS